ncbi:MAG: hypothetical protein M0P73_19535 [Syntrophobacterales bacterium]|jgi:hypothetical protein|nr:hypothetical protein [Syntrophobacterales bacterium]
MKSSIALVVALFLGLAGCSAATAPQWQNKADSVAYQHQQDAGQTNDLKALEEDPALGHWYTAPYINPENPG